MMTRRNLLGVASGLAVVAVSESSGIAQDTPPTPSVIPPGEPLEVRTPDGLALSGRTYGDPARPEILFIHGLGQSRLSWDRQLGGGLADRFRVVTYDLRGHGDSDKPLTSSAYSEGERWADDLAAVIKAAGLRRPVLVGWSLGGLVIGHYLAKHGPDAVGGVNLVNAVTKQSSEYLTPLAADFAARLKALDLSLRTRAIGDFLASCFVEPPPKEELARMLVYNGMVPRVLQESIVPIAGGEKLDAVWASVPRILITFGARDVLLRLTMAERMFQLNPKARLSIYPNVGHSPFYEDAARFNRELADFAGPIRG